MKKKITTILAVGAAACVLATAAGCSSVKTDLVALKSNWFTQTSVKSILPSVIEGSENFGGGEEITYSVKYNASTASNRYYSVGYGDGVYKTSFYATPFDYDSFDFPEEYKSRYGEVKNAVYAYYYRTELTLPDVTYTYAATGSSVRAGDDNVVQECYFLSVGEYLRPLYSKQTIKSSSPADFQPVENRMFATVDRVYENFYNLDGTQVTSKITVNDADDAGDESRTVVKTAGGTTTTFFDISSLNIAVRALNLSAELSQNIKIITPGGGISQYTATGSATETGLDETQTAALTAALGEANLIKDGELKTVAVSVNYSATTFTGGVQTMWFAALGADSELNLGRATMVKMTTPIAFALGALDFTLESIESTFES